MKLTASLSLSRDEASALSCALDFLMHYDAYPYDPKKFDYEDANAIAWVVDEGHLKGNRRELRAAATAINFSLHCLSDAPEIIEQVATVYPDLIPDLTECAPILTALAPRVSAFIASLLRK